MTVRITRTRKPPAPSDTNDSLDIPPLSDLEAEQAREEKALAAMQARIWARKKLMAAAKEYNQLSGQASPPESGKPARPDAAPKPLEAAAAWPIPALSTAKLAKGGGSYAIVLKVMRDNPQGLTAREIGRKAGEHPDAARSLKLHVHYIYSILDILQERGEVVKGADGNWRATIKPNVGGENRAAH